MNTFFRLCLTGPFVIALVGCGSTTPPASTAQSFPQGANLVTYDPTTGEVTLDGVVVSTDALNLVATNGAIDIYRAANITTVGGTAEAYAAVTSSLGAPAGASTSGQVIGRSAAPELPTTGSATYTGDYAGQIVSPRNDDTQFAFGLTTGDAAFEVSFADSSFTGEITNRELLEQNAGEPFPGFGLADIVISDGTITADSTFTATVTGGQVVSTDFGGNYGTTSPGDLNGLFGGATGSEIAGVLILPHDFPDTGGPFIFTYEEHGVIIATTE